MFHRARTYLALSLVLGAAPLAGCVAPEDTAPTGESTAGLPEEPAEGLYCVGERDPETSCPDRAVDSQLDPKTPTSASGYDLYFHPNNGLHGGWIESWRLCNEGGQNYRICTGGYAPVRYWNPASCGGTIQDYYPQGWSGWGQTFGGCSS